MLKVLILFSYPVVVHLSIYLGHAVWAVYYLSLLFALPLLFSLMQKRRPSWLVALSTLYSILIFWLASNQPENLLFAQPVIINLLLFFIFVSTLSENSVPLITRFTIILRPEVPDVVMVYCRWVTWAWAFFFLMLAVLSWLIAIYASIETWSWFANVLTYIFIGSMFIVEYIIRKMVLKGHVDRSFIQFIRDLRRVDYRQIVRGWRS